MREEQKGAVKNSIGRIFITALLILIQVVWLIELFIRLNKYSTGISLVSSAIALIVVIKIYGRDMNSAMKMPWMILIMAFPVAGVGIYLLCGHSGVNIGIRKHFQALQSELTPLLPDKEDILQKMSDEDRQTANMAHYISHSAGYPVYDNTDLEFYPEAVDGFEAQKEALKQAKKFIFMEYHAIEDAQSFAGMKSILFEKAKEGVEVRLIYDDVGSMGFINTDFVKQMESHGIQCRIFNKIVPFVNIFMNNRDHRKITVIDGQVGFTGGCNQRQNCCNDKRFQNLILKAEESPTIACKNNKSSHHRTHICFAFEITQRLADFTFSGQIHTDGIVERHKQMHTQRLDKQKNHHHAIGRTKCPHHHQTNHHQHLGNSRNADIAESCQC